MAGEDASALPPSRAPVRVTRPCGRLDRVNRTGHGPMKREENQTVEYKQSWHDKCMEWICGYANAKGRALA